MHTYSPLQEYQDMTPGEVISHYIEKYAKEGLNSEAGLVANVLVDFMDNLLKYMQRD